MTPLLRPCIECGDLSEQAHCAEHRPKREARPDHRRDTVTSTWINLSRRARRMQPFCTIPGCDQPGRLEADHSPRAWARAEAGKIIRLCDVTVLCSQHNAGAGSSRPDSDRYRDWMKTDGDLDATTPDRTLSSYWGVGVDKSPLGPRSESKCVKLRVSGTSEGVI